MPSMFANFVHFNTTPVPVLDDNLHKPLTNPEPLNLIIRPSAWIEKKRKRPELLTKTEKLTCGSISRSHRLAIFKRDVILAVDEAKINREGKPYEKVSHDMQVPLGNISRWPVLIRTIRISIGNQPLKFLICRLACICVCKHVCLSVCMCVCMLVICVCVFVYMCACMYACMYTSYLYVCMLACMYVSMCTCSYFL